MSAYPGVTEPPWIRRLRATSIGFPSHARDAPHRCLYQSNATGRTELYGWDRDRDVHARQTRREQGTWNGALSPDGAWVWWFDDTGGDERGRWMRQRFDTTGAEPGPEPEPALPDLPAAYPNGLALGRTVAAVGLSDRDGVRVHLRRDGAATTTVYSAERYATVESLSYDETLLAIGHSEHGDAFHPAVRVLRLPPAAGTDSDADIDTDADTGTVADLWDGPGNGLHAVAFAPVAGDARLLLRRERTGRSTPLVWDVATGVEREPAVDLPGELYPSWYPDGRALLLRHHWHARDELYRYDLAPDRLERLPTPAGSVHGCAVRPDRDLEYLATAADRPPAVLSATGRQVLVPPERPPTSVPLTDAWVDGPAGPVHALVARPDGAGDRPGPLMCWLHGGPGGEMVDSFDVTRAAFVDAGYTVVHVNYRGSDGYGTGWLDADRERPGLVELEDVAAVRDWAVGAGIAAADRCVIAGASWGGYLTLLGLGTQPERWAAGVAVVPIGDMVALYEDEMEPVREHDRSLFGGTPEEIPDKWRRSSPVTYADRVRAPLLVLASRNDPRCPIRQVENYLAALDRNGQGYEVYRFESGHFSMVIEEQIRQLRIQLDFCGRHVPAGAP